MEIGKDDDSNSIDSNEQELFLDVITEGNLYDSDKDGEKIDVHNNYLEEVQEEEREHFHYCSVVREWSNADEYQLRPVHEGDVAAAGMSRGGKPILGAPEGWSPPCPPDNWSFQQGKGAPPLDAIDNPGEWNLWSYYGPRYNKKREYTGYYTPAGTKVVPADSNGKCIINGWEFHYQGWKPNEFDQSTFVCYPRQH
jgi:hypothetical protein